MEKQLNFVKPSTRRFFRESKELGRYGFIDWLHGYIYGRWAYFYIGVGTGRTGHVEAVRIAYDPAVITLSEILDRFFGLFDATVPHPEAGVPGSQYRSAVFCHTEEDCRLVQAYLRDAEPPGNPERPVVTVVQQAGPFWPAEACHQQYYEKMANRYQKPLF